MDATFKVKPAEFDDLIRQIKSYFLNENTDAIEITISIKKNNSLSFEQKLQKSIAEADSDADCISFSPDEFKTFVKNRLAQ
jgi:hypothetical protein